MKKLFFILLSFAFLTACERKIDEIAPSANGVDFSKFVAVGNSMTSGFSDAALYKSGQINSLPNILSTQFQLVGGGEFRQPLIETEDGIGVTQIPGGFHLSTKTVLKIVQILDCAGTPTGEFSMRPAPLIPNPDQQQLMQQLFAPPLVSKPYNNMAVPGVNIQSIFYPRLGDPTPDGHSFNPYFVRFASSPTASIIQDAMAQSPTFFFFWIGNIDGFGSALSGNDLGLTPIDTFAKYYPMAVGALINSGNTPKGILANIPDITSLPYFSTISKSLPYNGVVLTEEEAAGLNMLYTMYQHPEIQWHPGSNPFVYIKSDGTWAQMGPDDIFLLTLPTDSIKCKGMGVADPVALKPYPIPDKFILNKSELDNISLHIHAYNQIIAQTAATANLALVDFHTYLESFKSGMVFDGVTMSTTFVQGGLFSTDGIHPVPRGYAVLANYCIQAINNHYGCYVPQVDITAYPGLVFP